MIGKHIQINGCRIGPGCPTYIIAEISANHNHDIEVALELIAIAAEAGADAVKIQTYTPDTLTIDCDNEYFSIGAGTPWEGRKLYDLYAEAYTPWEWLPELQEVARANGIALFSSPFDATSVDFLESHNVPAYKIASFELTDHPLLVKVAKTGKPVILSTGMGSLIEIAEAIEVLKLNGCEQLVLLKCTSAYPAPVEEANLARIAHMSECFGVPVGLSDHTMGDTVASIAVSMGACVVEKHFTKSRSTPGPDSSFSLEPNELKDLVSNIRVAEQCVGKSTYELTEKEVGSRVFRKSIFVVESVEEGEIFSADNLRVIRPGYGVHPKFIGEVVGGIANRSIPRGTPFEWSMLK